MPNLVPEKLFRKSLDVMRIACVDVAIVDCGSVLLVTRKDAPARGEWWVPGGRVWKREMLRETAARKARDEVGIDCHIGPIIHTAEAIFHDGPGGVDVHSINACIFAYLVAPAAVARLGPSRRTQVGAQNPRGAPSLRHALPSGRRP